jgi:phenylalanyl-tRNA synthetase beta chain
MKILLSWLRDYIEIRHSAGQIAEMLSDLGFPCEGIEHLDGDAVIDVEVTSNRGDCLSYIGIARELSVAAGKELKLPVVKPDESGKDASNFASVEIAEPDLCGRYTARIIEGVKVGPSPQWMVKRLEAAGMRSVSNVVDATNYAMLETGQPPHAFDYAKIKDGKIIVRKAVAGERIVSIDGTKCDLDPGMLVIADPRGPVAVAGVMGGLDTEVNSATTTVLLEDAHFNPVCVRTTSRRLSLPSEASFRFERIVDIDAIDWASQRTAQLITQVAGGRVAKGVVDVYPHRKQPKQVTLRLSRLEKLLGVRIPHQDVIRILSALGCGPHLTEGVVTCQVPSWRSDVYREVDLVEEVARVYGYDKIPTEQRIDIEVTPVDRRQKMLQAVGRYLNACGFYQAVTVTFVDKAVAELFTGPQVPYLAVRDLTRKTDNLLRQGLLGSLLGVLKTNLNAKNRPCRVFEIADTFVPRTENRDALPVEQVRLALVCDSDLRDVRGVIEGLIKSIDREADIVFEPASLIWADTAAQIWVNGELLGTSGVVSQAVKDKFDFKEVTPVVAELEFERLIALQAESIKVKPIPRFPEIERDLSIVVDEEVPWADISAAVCKKACSELENVRFVDIYRGKGIPDGKKSVTLSLCFRDDDGTLTHDEVDEFQKVIVESLSDTVKAELRAV